MSTSYVNLVHTKFHQVPSKARYVHGKPIPMCRVTPQFVTACNVVEHLQSYMKHDMCHAHLGQCKGILQSKNIIRISALWVCSQQCRVFWNTIQQIFQQVSWTQAGLESLSAGPETGLTHLPLPWLGRPRPGLSDSLLLGKFSLLHLIRAGAQSHLWASPGTDGHQAAKCGAREKCSMWQYLSLFERC